MYYNKFYPLCYEQERKIAMSLDYVNIEASTNPDIVKQNLKFKTGKFVWKVKFTAPLNPATINNSNLYVVNASGDKIKASISYDEVSNCIEIEPFFAYEQSQSYVLHVTRNVESRGGQRLKKEVLLKFNI